MYALVVFICYLGYGCENMSCIQYVDCSVKCPVLDVEYSG